MSSDDQVYRRMQVKVLYSFDNSPTVFLSRSKTQYSVKVAQIPLSMAESENEFLTLGAFDLKNCVTQILKSSPENFKLDTEDYAVYYKDITEQPDEPFVANGELSTLLSLAKPYLIPGRVCQNLSASFLFGDKANASSLTLEIRLKLHVIEKNKEEAQQKDQESERSRASNQSHSRKRKQPPPNTSSSAALKATRTKSLPIFYHPPNQQISSIIYADKLNAAPKYDSKSIQERFNLAPFLLAKIIDKPSRKRRRSNVPLTPSVLTPVDGSYPHRAMRTRSMMTSLPIMSSSPVNGSESTDDTDYNENTHAIDEEEEEEEEDADYNLKDGVSSPYLPMQTYKLGQSTALSKSDTTTTTIIATENNTFQSLPDLEDLDSKKIHTIPSTKLPDNHDLLCINKNCAANDSVTWRYFETKFNSNYLNIQRSKVFDKKMYDGMFGPLCNACYLFLRNKGFMRPEAVVKKYLQQQKYKRELKLKEESSLHQLSSPANPDHKFAIPSHAPSTINEVIKNREGMKTSHQISSTPNQTPGGDDFQDLNDFMNQLNNFGGPLTDIDLPHDAQVNKQETTPPMMATKSNTRVINLYEEEEDKENFPPQEKEGFSEIEHMVMKSFNLRSSPDQDEWSHFFNEPTPKDNCITPATGKTPVAEEESSLGKTYGSTYDKLDNQNATVVNMPSSPLLSSFDTKQTIKDTTGSSSPSDRATRNDTTMSYVNGKKSSPHSDIFADDGKI